MLKDGKASDRGGGVGIVVRSHARRILVSNSVGIVECSNSPSLPIEPGIEAAYIYWPGHTHL